MEEIFSFSFGEKSLLPEMCFSTSVLTWIGASLIVVSALDPPDFSPKFPSIGGSNGLVPRDVEFRCSPVESEAPLFWSLFEP